MLAVAAFATAGCADPSAGSADPSGAAAPGQATTEQATTTTATTTTATTTPGPEFVQRPREIPLDSLDPCQVWTPAQLGQLVMYQTPDEGDPSPGTLGDLTCNFRGPREPVEIQYTAVVSMRADIVDLYGTTATRTTETVIEVAGFPAIQFARPQGSIDPCTVVIGTAAGQYLWIDLSVFPNDDLSVADACQRATTAATMAMDTLQAIR